MKSWVILVALISISILLFGCTTTSGLMALDSNNNLVVDSNLDANNNVYNNLDNFKKAKMGDNLDLHYILRFENGSIYQSSYDSGKPFNVTLGETSLIKGFVDGILGMRVGEKKMIVISPEQGYGNYDSNLIRLYDKNALELSKLGELKVGKELLFGGTPIVGITEVNDNNVVIDFNHKLAGKTLIFEITLISIN